VAIFGIMLVLLGVLLTGIKRLGDLGMARRREAALEQQIEASQAEIQRLKQRNQRLRGDPTLLERLAREDLGLAAPEDLVVVIPEGH
jgi:cell division protein FtsB